MPFENLSFKILSSKCPFFNVSCFRFQILTVLCYKRAEYKNYFSGFAQAAVNGYPYAEQLGGADVSSGVCHAGNVRKQKRTTQENVLHVPSKLIVDRFHSRTVNPV